VRLEGDHAVVRIPGELQKSRRDEIYATAPEFRDFLAETPADKRSGPVFELLTEGPGGELRPVASVNPVSKIVADIGRAAGVVVDERERRNPDGTTRTVRKWASAHDLRRSFGTRWAKRVMPAVLKALMRHANITTTLKFYAEQDAANTAEAALAAYLRAVGNGDEAGDGNASGNTSPETSVFSEKNVQDL